MPADLNALKQDLSRRMDGALETLKREFSGLRAGRASPALLEPVRVAAYGNEVPLNQVGSVGSPEAAHVDGAGLGPLPGRRGGQGDPRVPGLGSTRHPTAS